MQRVTWFFVFLATVPAYAADPHLVLDPTADNYAIIVSVTQGLPGAKQDLENVRAMVSRPEFNFRVLELHNKDATVPVTRAMLTHLASKLGDRGTLFFYFGGHGGGGKLYMGDDKFFSAKDFKNAIAKGRQEQSPVERLLIFIDACESGTFVDPWRRIDSHWFDAFLTWSPEPSARNLMLLTSSKGDELSVAEEVGSNFTNALRQGFEESISKDLTLGDWADLTSRYTLEHHPVARFIPEELSNEKLMHSP